MLDQIISGEQCEMRKGYKKRALLIVCADGVTLSVQASSFHYCRPRSDDGPYSHVEVGFPSIAPPESWAQYFDGDWEMGDCTDSVYGYIPVELVREFVDAHGGEK